MFMTILSLLSSVSFAQSDATYSGRTPIDLKNGTFYSQGTYGARNEQYEEWSKHPQLPSLEDESYPFSRKDALLSSLEEQASFGEEAMLNWSRTSNRWPEVSEYAKNAIDQLRPTLDRFEAAVAKLKSAGASDWPNAEDAARRALVDWRLGYTQLHKNIVNR
jgi:hypothetical protein